MTYSEKLVQEHSELMIKINKLHKFLYDNNGINLHTDIKNNTTQDALLENMIEYANKCIQLNNMRNYAKALECRLNNIGIAFNDGTYSKIIAKLNPNA